MGAPRRNATMLNPLSNMSRIWLRTVAPIARRSTGRSGMNHARRCGITTIPGPQKGESGVGYVTTATLSFFQDERGGVDWTGGRCRSLGDGGRRY